MLQLSEKSMNVVLLIFCKVGGKLQKTLYPDFDKKIRLSAAIAMTSQFFEILKIFLYIKFMLRKFKQHRRAFLEPVTQHPSVNWLIYGTPQRDAQKANNTRRRKCELINEISARSFYLTLKSFEN